MKREEDFLEEPNFSMMADEIKAMDERWFKDIREAYDKNPELVDTEDLVDYMISLELDVNRDLALEIGKREDALFYLRKLLQDGMLWYSTRRGNGWAPIHAIHILPLIKTKEALKLLLDIMRYKEEELSDWLTEDCPTLLAAFGEDAIKPLKEYTQDETLETFARSSAQAALTVIAHRHPDRKEEIKNYLRKLFKEASDITFTSCMAGDILSFKDPGVLADVYAAFDEGRIDPTFIGRDEVDEIFNSPEEKQDYQHHMGDPLDYFSEENLEFLRKQDYQEESEKDQKKKKKVGRNDPCPCGSGKKYKNCCWLKDHTMQ